MRIDYVEILLGGVCLGALIDQGKKLVTWLLLDPILKATEKALKDKRFWDTWNEHAMDEFEKRLQAATEAVGLNRGSMTNSQRQKLEDRVAELEDPRITEVWREGS
ncbi:MAG: hypothetical protein QNJ46_05965 [Leptolyngbyaceae cyanobacterium MO_188.B28]|nr:hypothetical protein [Leptolyngbyaceae cyanobacterium MO_188.B28]